MLDAGYYVYNWVELGHAYSDLVRKHRGGALRRRSTATATWATTTASRSTTPCSAATCRGPAGSRTRARSWSVHRSAPFLTWGNTWYNAPCLSWKAPSHRRLAVSGSALTSKILLISETRDAATPYAGALAVRRLFPTASLVAGIGGTTHPSSLSGVACVDNTVASYLRTGIVPRRQAGNRSDRRCSRLVPPQPDGTWGRTPGQQAATTLSPLLRADPHRGPAAHVSLSGSGRGRCAARSSTRPSRSPARADSGSSVATSVTT